MKPAKPTPPGAVRAQILAQHEHLLEECIDPRTGKVLDHERLEKYAELVEELTSLSRERLLALRILPGVGVRHRTTAAAGSPGPLRDQDELLIFLRLAEFSGSGFGAADLKGTITYVNPALARMLGTDPPDRLIGRSVYDYYPEESKKLLLEKIVPSVIRHDSWTGELPLLSRDGRTIPTIQNLFVLRGERAEARYLANLIIDITERTRMEESLRRSEENFRALAENANDGILIAIGEGRHVFANLRAAEISGYSVDELTQIGLQELATPEELPRIRESYRLRMAGKPLPRRYETAIQRRDGSRAEVEISGSRTIWQGEPADIVIMRDVTERKRAEQALRASEERFRTLVENIDEVAYSIDSKGVLTYVSPSITTLAGYTAEELIGKRYSEHFLEEDMTRLRASFRKVASGAGPQANEYRFRTKSGEVRWIRTSSHALQRDGRIVGVHGVLLDITERKRAELALEESERHFREILAEIDDLVYEIDAEGTVTYISPVSEKMLGYRPEELLGRSFYEYISGTQQAISSEVFRQLQAGETPPPIEVEAVHRDGESRWLHVSFLPYSAGGRVAGVRGVAVDITERRAMEQAIQESERRFRELVEETDDMVYAMDPTGIATYISPGCEKLIGFSPEEIIGQSFRKFIAHEQRETSEQAFQQALMRPDPPPVERRVRTKDGGHRWVRISTRPQIVDGRVVSLRGIFVDITPQKQLEEALRASEERYASIVEGAWLGVGINQDGRVVYANSALADMLGYTVDELTGREILSVIVPEDHPKVLQIAESLEGQRGTRLTESLRYVCRDGSIRRVEIYGSVIHHEDRPALLAVVRPLGPNPARPGSTEG